MLRYLHCADGAEYKHTLNAPDGPITLELARNSYWSPETRKTQEQEGQEGLLADVQSGTNPWRALIMLLNLS